SKQFVKLKNFNYCAGRGSLTEAGRIGEVESPEQAIPAESSSALTPQWLAEGVAGGFCPIPRHASISLILSPLPRQRASGATDGNRPQPLIWALPAIPPPTGSWLVGR